MARRRILVLVISIVFLSASFGWGLEKGPAKPGPGSKCPVCGMFVAKYPDFLAQVVFKDRTSDFFDGSKDMFKYLLNLKKYNPKQKQSDIEIVYVTDYYSLTPIDGMKAFYVHGSDVYGPMGRELIPFEKESEAKTFMKDHRGKNVLRFREITDSIIRTLD